MMLLIVSLRAMTSDVMQLLRIIADNLKGKLKYYECSDKHSYHKKIVIEYAHKNKD